MVNSLLAVDGRTEETAEELHRLVMGSCNLSAVVEASAAPSRYVTSHEH